MKGTRDRWKSVKEASEILDVKADTLVIKAWTHGKLGKRGAFFKMRDKLYVNIDTFNISDSTLLLTQKLYTKLLNRFIASFALDKEILETYKLLYTKDKKDNECRKKYTAFQKRLNLIFTRDAKPSKLDRKILKCLYAIRDKLKYC